MKNKICCTVNMICLSLIMCFLICACSNSQTRYENYTDADSIERDYYQQTEKITGSYLYIPLEKDFAVQLPEYVDMRLADNSEKSGSRLSYSGSYGSITVNVLEDEAYIEKSEEELSNDYFKMFYGDIENYKIVNIQFLRDASNNEIGRSYEVTSEDGKNLIYIRELKYEDNIIRVVAQPSIKNDDINIIKQYADSFILL